MEKDSKDYTEWRNRRAGDFTLQPDSTALLIIDMQYTCASRTEGEGRVAKEMGAGASVDYRFSRVENVLIPNINRLLDFFRKNGLRIIYVTLGSEMPDYSDLFPHRRESSKRAGNTKGNREHEILDELKPLPGECVINKITTGAFNSSNIDMVLKAMAIKQILFTGVSTEGCVEGTLRGANDRGYRCLAVEDGCSDWTKERHDSTIMRFRKKGRVETTEDVIGELATALARKSPSSALV